MDQRIAARVAALRVERGAEARALDELRREVARRAVLVAQYDAAIAELAALLQPEQGGTHDGEAESP